MRRLSGSKTRDSTSLAPDHVRQYENYESGPGQNHVGKGRRHSESGNLPTSEERASYFPPQSSIPTSTRPTNTFHRRPTNLSEKAALKAAARGGAEGNIEGRESGHIDLEGGLDISLNMEVNHMTNTVTPVPGKPAASHNDSVAAALTQRVLPASLYHRCRP